MSATGLVAQSHAAGRACCRMRDSLPCTSSRGQSMRRTTNGYGCSSGTSPAQVHFGATSHSGSSEQPAAEFVTRIAHPIASRHPRGKPGRLRRTARAPCPARIEMIGGEILGAGPPRLRCRCALPCSRSNRRVPASSIIALFVHLSIGQRRAAASHALVSPQDHRSEH